MSIDRLSAADQVMLEADVTWPQDVGAIGVLDGHRLFDGTGAFQIDAARAAVESRLHLVPRFRQVVHVPRRFLGGPLWLDAPDFDIHDHVHVRSLLEGADEGDLLLEVERLRSRRLDAARPLWEMWFLPGLADGRVALFVRMHHAIADGRAAMTLFAALLDSVPDARIATARTWIPRPQPPTRELLTDNAWRILRGVGGAVAVLLRPRTTLRQVRAALPAMRELVAEAPATDTSLNRLIGPHRTFALVRSDVDRVRRIARVHDASVNDVLLAVTAGGLRSLLLHRGEPVRGVTVRIYVPVSLRRRLRGPVQGNRISQMVVPLRLGTADPRRRLMQIAAETAKRKTRSRISLGALFSIGIVSWVMLRAIIRQRVNVTSASIPGPRRPLYLAGARVLELFPVLNLIGNEPLGVGALSYAGTMNVCVVADADVFPDIDVFAAGMRTELEALAVGAGGPPSEERALVTA